MRLVPAPAQGVAAGRPLPFTLRDDRGRVLLERGALVPSPAHVAALLQRGIWVTADEAETFERAYKSQLEQLVRQDAMLGEIASAAPDLDAMQAAPAGPDSPALAWSQLVRRANGLLRAPPEAGFTAALAALQAELAALLARAPDRALLALVFRAGREAELYAASHAVLVAVMAELVAQVLSLPLPERRQLGCVALSMNLGMFELQNRLALQPDAPDAAQRAAIAGHAAESVRLLRQLGVEEPVWLEAVAQHHAAAPGPLAARAPGSRLARIVRQADLFAARLSPRHGRRALSAAAAAQAAYLDEQRQPDEAGAALIKATGLYPPGCLVRLASGEVGVVLRRGPQADKPVVASLVGKGGLPLGVPALRHTRQEAHAVKASLAPHEVNLRLELEPLLSLA